MAQRKKQILMPKNKKEEKLKSIKFFLIAFGLLFLIFFAFSQIRKSGVIQGNVTEASPIPSEIAAVPNADGDQAALIGDSAAKLVQPADFTYLGAFRLPGSDTPPKTFAYGGNAMTFNPDGDPSGPKDGFPGSLFISGHDRMAYGDLPNGGQVAEISIPVPAVSGRLSRLKQASFLQKFQEVAKEFFHDMEEIPRMGMQYLRTAATGPKVHIAWGQHFEPEPPVGTHAWFDPNLKAPHMRGTWRVR
jgi:hypothetical protein